jgi:hypothetical protein
MELLTNTGGLNQQRKGIQFVEAIWGENSPRESAETPPFLGCGLTNKWIIQPEL